MGWILVNDELQKGLDERYNFRVWRPLKNPLEFVRKCVKKCETEHGSQCRGSSSQQPSACQVLPTRVIDVSGQGATVRLIETTSTSYKPHLSGQYCALSHAWGPPGSETLPATTTKKNLVQRRQGILISDLSKTFQEAIEITRSIGIEYLWIDSLCILQDDLTDWEREAKEMKSVYMNSYLTIAATGARDGSQGCLFSSEREGRVPIPLWKGQSEASPLFLRKSVPVKTGSDWYLGPLQYRAWITQEWILSTRLLHCCRTELIWKCEQEEKSESGISYDLTQHTLDLGPEWRETVSLYTHRSLTKITDRLTAMQGVFDEMSKRFNTGCAFGILMKDACRELLWKPSKKTCRPQELADLGIPSWSWGSVVGGIQPYLLWDSFVFTISLPFSGVDFEFSSEISKDLLVHCRHPFPLEQPLSSLSKYKPRLHLDEDLGNQRVDNIMVFILPTIVHNPFSDDRDKIAYNCLLLSVVKPTTRDTPAIFRRIGTLFNWKSGAFIESQDGHDGDSMDIIIR